MDINIGLGEKIKDLRKKRDITQEQLADYLKISFQSVSKWERGDAYPDITLLPKIALFFNTTTDEILCVDKAKIEVEIENYYKLKHEAQKVGETAKAIEIMREANEKYPGNYKLMSTLMHVIHFYACAQPKEEAEAYFKEVIEIGEKIQAECTDNKIRIGALQTLCFSYGHLGEKEKAEKFINDNLPNVYLSSQVMLGHTLEGERLTEHTQANLTTFLDFVTSAIQSLSKNFSIEDKIKEYEKTIKMYYMVYEDGNFGFYHLFIKDTYFSMARFYMQLNNAEKAIECLVKMSEHAIKFDTTETPADYTAPLVNKLKHTGITKNYKGNASYLMLKELDNDYLDPIKQNKAFEEIKENLKKYSRDDV